MALKSSFPRSTSGAIWHPCRSKSRRKVASPRLSYQAKWIRTAALRAELQECASEATPVLLVDFAGVDYIDSSGLATFIEYLRDASAYKGKIALFGMKQKGARFSTSCGSTSSLPSQTRPIRPRPRWPRSSRP